MKKKILIIGLGTILVIFICFIIYNSSYNFIYKDKRETKISVNYTENISVTKELKTYVGNNKYTIDDPKIISDPYGNSPLTALIFFVTSKEEEIKVYINDNLVTTMEKSKNHVIPIYGLIADYNNKITLEDSNKKYDYYIKNYTSNIFDEATYEINYEPDEYLILNTSKGNYAIDNDKNLVWSSNNSTMDINFIDSDTYLVADNNNRVIKTDLLGQVYDVYYDFVQNENHKIKYYDDNMIITTPEYHLVSINIETGEEIFDINIDEIFTNIDKNFTSTLSEYKKSNLYNLYHMNNYEYNKEDNTILLSLRGLNAIVNYDIENEQIIWLFSDNKTFGKEFDEYKLNLTSGSYVHGQHTPYLEGNKLYIFDNNLGGKNTNKARAVIYEIDGNDIKEIYSYDSTYYSSLFGGSFYEKDNIKQINFGCTISNSQSQYTVLELDENNKIIANFVYGGGKYTASSYSTFRQKFYEDETSNYEFYNLNKINKISNKGDKITSSIKEEFKNALIDENLVKIENNTITLSQTDTSATIYLVGKDKKVHEINYNNNVSYDNITSYLTTIKGKYAIYVKYDGTMYNTNQIINIY